MKHSTFKYILLSVLLVFALVALSSCYIAPDDVNGDGGDLSTNSLPFATMAPTATATVTQETVVVQTQNIFNNATATPTTAPADPGATVTMNVWGVIATTNSIVTEPTVTPTAVPDIGGTVTLVTATPEPGTSVPGGDPGTVTVVTSEPAKPATVTKAPVTPTPEPASMRLGFTGDAVRKLQKRLKELGYYTGSVDGDFGAATDKAVKAFQKMNGLSADGKVGNKTSELLYSSKAIKAGGTPTPKKNATPTPKKTATPTPKKTATPTPRPTATPNLSKDYYLSAGASGAKVKTMQNRLIELGWLQGKATGDFDAATEAAVKAFQKKAGVWSDGVAGPDTLKALYSEKAPKTSNAAASTGETLEDGSTGSAVRALQTQLKKLGYYNGSIDGSFGAGTKAAVIAFQSKNGLTADGKAGNATLNKLYSSDAKSASSSGSSSSGSTIGSIHGVSDESDIGSTGYVTLELGSSGSAVNKLQKRLKELGYYSGNTDGSFGEGTEAAVRAYQKMNNLTVDGKAGPATQRKLYGTTSSIAYNTLELGTTGTTVKNLQYTLYELGYYDGPRDGIYGDSTSDAVRAFQIQNKLSPVDGKAGSKTLARLYSSDAIPASAAAVNDDSIYPGEKGNRVYEVQDCLVALGYLDKVSNIYDDATVAAVKAFQKDNGLTADGICGARTLQILFGY